MRGVCCGASNTLANGLTGGLSSVGPRGNKYEQERSGLVSFQRERLHGKARDKRFAPW